MISFKAIGALLDYPTAELLGALDEIEQALGEERAIPVTELDGVRALIDRLRKSDIMDAQEYWIGLFDRSKRLALHLYEHSHGESRDRGQAMVNLALTYRMNGFELNASEMPDYLPLFLEFLSVIPEVHARRYLTDAIEIIEALRIRLEERDSTYAALLSALVTLAQRDADDDEVEAILATEPQDPKDLDELDREWAEDPVDFTAGSALKDCPIFGRCDPKPGRGACEGWSELMQSFVHSALFSVYPYVALSIFLIGSLVRFDADQYGWRSKSSQFLRRRQLVWGSILFHVGILGILGGHAVGLLTPVVIFEFLGISHGFKQMMAIVVGGICGIACFVGLAMLLHRRLFDSRIRKTSSISDIAVLLILFAQLSLGLATIPLSLGHLDGAMMVRFMNYVQGIVTLRPGVAAEIADVPLIFKLHMFLGFTIFLVFPFTRLVHVWSVPLGYLARNYQVVRTKRRAIVVEADDDLPAYVAKPVLRQQPVRKRKAA